MRRWLAILLLLLPVLAFGQCPADPVREKCDTLSPRKFKTADIVGISLIGVGTLGIAATVIERDLLLAMVGETTKADYYICGGIAVAGIATLVTSRILAVKKAKNYDVTPVAYSQGGGGLALKITF
jgi:hypothetical protein